MCPKESNQPKEGDRPMNATDVHKLPPMDLRTTPKRSITSGPLGVARLIVSLFSYGGGGLVPSTDCSMPQRDPPDSNDKVKSSNWRHIRLITITPSNYCEKARWALDLLEEKAKKSKDDDEIKYYYTEDGHPPAFLAFETLRASNYQSSASPMIVVDNGSTANGKRVIAKSDFILREMVPFLYPEPIANKIREVEDELGETIGAAVRCVLYYYMLHPDAIQRKQDRKRFGKAMCAVCCNHSSKVESKLFAAMLDKGVAETILRVLKINKQTCQASVETLHRVFDEVSKKLEQASNRNNLEPYIMDSDLVKTGTWSSFGFTAVDLSFAALTAPLLRPESFAPNFSAVKEEELPQELVELKNKLLETIAGQHVLRMYEKHRPKGINGVVEMKTKARDRLPLAEMVYGLGLLSSVAVAIFWVRHR